MTTIKPGYIVRHSNNTLASSIRGVGQFIDNQIKKIKQLLSKLLNPTDYKLEKIDIIQEITKISIDLLELENNGHRFKHNTNYLSKYIKTLLELTQLRFDDFNKDNSGKMKYQEKINQLYNIVAQANNFILDNRKMENALVINMNLIDLDPYNNKLSYFMNLNEKHINEDNGTYNYMTELHEIKHGS